MIAEGQIIKIYDHKPYCLLHVKAYNEVKNGKIAAPDHLVQEGKFLAGLAPTKLGTVNKFPLSDM